MRSAFLIVILFLNCANLLGQTQLTGKVTDTRNHPLPGANVFIPNSYDGATADSLGNFSFKTSLKGNQNLSASFIGYKTVVQKIDLDASGSISLVIQLQDSEDQLDEVVVNAGTFEASDEKKAVVLRVFDIATTPSAQGDIFGAFGTLPGVQKVGEDGRVFVRGGEGYETKTFMDGMLVASPYTSKMPDMPARGRFSPLLFSGTLFSTGAYSAEYGQALSSIVDMKTNSIETEEKSSISVMTVGLMGSTTHCSKNSSLSLNGDLLSSALSNKINKQQVDWTKAPLTADATVMFRQKTGKTGMYKLFGTFNTSSSEMNYPNIQTQTNQALALGNSTIYLNNTYSSSLTEKWIVKSGLAWNYDHQILTMDDDRIITNQKMIQAKIGLCYFINEQTEFRFGSDWVNFSYEQKISMDGDFRLPFANNELSGFAEVEYKPSRKLATRIGARAENSSLLNASNLGPRFSGAYKTGKHSQVSLACGGFYQNPENDYLKFAPQLKPEKATHAVFTWQYQTEQQTFRVEGYLKKYTQLVKYTAPLATNPLDYSNSGSGRARGIDLFWRDKQSLKNTDYWISYSWIDALRNYRDYIEMAVPTFVSTHNLSLVFKRFLPALSTYASATYSFASSRPYHDPNVSGFMNAHTKAYNDISLSLTHILHFFGKQAALHLMLNNVAGFDNIYGYNFATTPNAEGKYESSPIRSPFVRQAVLLINIML